MCFSCICLFVLYVLVFVNFFLLLVSRLAAVCDCGTSWTFLLTILQYMSVEEERQITVLSYTKALVIHIYYR